jgi:hypothetical protein
MMRVREGRESACITTVPLAALALDAGGDRAWFAEHCGEMIQLGIGGKIFETVGTPKDGGFVCGVLHRGDREFGKN